MITTVSEAISNVKSDFRLSNADRRITVKHIYSLLKKFTKRLIKQESDKLSLVKSDIIWQTLNCIETIEVPTTDECCRFTSKCSILRTKEKIPDLYEDSWGIILRSVNSIDFSQDFQPIKMSEWTRKLDNANFKYDKTLYYFYKNGYLYFPNCKWKLISITGYFVDDISKYNTCEEQLDCPISILDSEWRVPGYLQEPIINLTIQELGQTFVQIPPQPEVHINKNPQ